MQSVLKRIRRFSEKYQKLLPEPEWELPEEPE
jgi:hypothetical protein